MTLHSYETWQSIWTPLLTEAANRANVREHGSPGFAQSATSIILAKASWEAFQNEFVELRDLPVEIKAKSLTNALLHISTGLGVEPFTFSQGTIWEALLCVNRLRNAITHHTANPHKAGEAPAGLLKSLQRYGVVVSPCSTVPWESLLVTPRSAAWSCRIVGTAMVELERIPSRRRRSPSLVEERVSEALEAILEEWPSSYYHHA